MTIELRSGAAIVNWKVNSGSSRNVNDTNYSSKESMMSFVLRVGYVSASVVSLRYIF